MKYKIPLLILFIILSAIYLYKQDLLFPKQSIYVSINGNDSNNGSKSKPLRTIQHAVDLSKPGITVKILPGIYRESVTISKSGTGQKPIKIAGSGNVELNGSETSSGLIWHSCTQEICPEISQKDRQNIYVTTLPWPEKPYLLHEISTDGTALPLHLARTPNIKTTDNTPSLEKWWKAEKSLPNQHILSDPANLIINTDLTEAVAYIMDGADRCGNFIYTRNIDRHDNKQGSLFFNSPVGFSVFGSQENGIGPETIYYIEGDLHLLDAPGEWYYDEKDKKLYIRTWKNENPRDLQIEISRRNTGIIIRESSDIVLDGLSIRYINNDPHLPGNTGAIVINPDENKQLQSIKIQNISVRSSFSGIIIQSNKPDSSVKDVSIIKSHLSNILKEAISVVSNPYTEVSEVKISDSEFDHNGSYSNNPAINIARTDNVFITNNDIHDNASYGIHITGNERNPEIVKNINIEKNMVTRSCQNTSSCGGVKIYGGKFQNTGISENFITDNKGWSNCSTFAVGVFISNASGISVNKNIILQNSGMAVEVYPRQIEANNNIFTNNLLGYSSVGIDLSNPESAVDYDGKVRTTRHDNTVIKNNIFIKNMTGLKAYPENPSKLLIDFNAYIDNGKDFVNGNASSNNWDKSSIRAATDNFKDISKRNFNLPYSSRLRGGGESIFPNTLIIGKILNFIGLGSDIGPCPFRWFKDSCPVLDE